MPGSRSSRQNRALPDKSHVGDGGHIILEWPFGDAILEWPFGDAILESPFQGMPFKMAIWGRHFIIKAPRKRQENIKKTHPVKSKIAKMTRK